MSPDARLATMTWRWIDNDHEAVLAWLRGVGMTVRQLDTDTWAIDGLSGVTVGLSVPPPDPLAVVIPLGMAFFGPWWPQAVPHALDLVRGEWRRRRNAHRHPSLPQGA